MNDTLQEIINCPKLNNMGDSDLKNLNQLIQDKAAKDSGIWRIYLSLRWHKQFLDGDLKSKEALSRFRKHFSESDLAIDSPINNVNYMRRIFYPKWMALEEEENNLPELFFGPDGESEIETKFMDFLNNFKIPEIKALKKEAIPHGYDFDIDPDGLVRRWEENNKANDVYKLKDKLAKGEKFGKSDLLTAYSLMRWEVKGGSNNESRKRWKSRGIQACHDKYLNNKKCEFYPFAINEWKKNLLLNAVQLHEVFDEYSEEVADLLKSVMKQIESESYHFNMNSAPPLRPLLRARGYLNGVDTLLNPICFQYDIYSRHETSGGMWFQVLAEADHEWPIIVAHALSRMDLAVHLFPVIEANKKSSTELKNGFSSWIVLELVQAGRILDAIKLLTGRGAKEALQSGDKLQFDRASCLMYALKAESAYSYSGAFNYVCSRLPELAPNIDGLAESLDLLEKTVLADPFWENPDRHQEFSLIALAGAMLRCGEFDRARHLIEKCIGKFGLKSDDEWSLVRIQYLDAACYWFLNGKPDLMIQMLGDYLHLRIR